MSISKKYILIFIFEKIIHSPYVGANRLFSYSASYSRVQNDRKLHVQCTSRSSVVVDPAPTSKLLTYFSHTLSSNCLDSSLCSFSPTCLHFAHPPLLVYTLYALQEIKHLFIYLFI